MSNNSNQTTQTHPVTVEPFTMPAQVKAKFDIRPTVDVFYQELHHQLGKQAAVINHPAAGSFKVRGQFERIDSGNRLLRYMMSAGHAVIAVRSELFRGDVKIGEFSSKDTAAIGLFGGDGQTLLKRAARGAAKDLSAKIAKTLRT